MRKHFPQLALINYFGAWFIYFGWFWSHALTFDQAGNLRAGLVNIWGDWAAHFTMGSAMGYRELFLSESPFLIGNRFSYPFITNFISAVLIRAGVPFFDAFIVPSFIGSCLLVVALFYFFVSLLRSQKLAIMASLIFLLNGGLGFVYFGNDVLSSPTPLATFLSPPHEYTRLDDQHIKWISVIDSMVIPQRAFNLGFPLTLIALAMIYQVFYHQKTRYRYPKLLTASLILGVMPLIHTHSFLAAGIILSFWMAGSFLKLESWNWHKIRQLLFQWGIVGVVSLSLAVPFYLYFFAQQTEGFLKFYPGWLAREYKVNWLVFWFKNWALTPLLAIGGLLVVYKPWQKKLFIWVPFFVIFVLINLILFQPFVWDNTKLLVWAAVGMSGLVAVFLNRLFEMSQKLTHRWRGIAATLVVTLFLVTIASGAIDAYWDLRTDLHSYQMYSTEELQLAEWVKTQTPVDSIWLTGDQHNHWLFNLTGRQPLMAYRGWLWTYGYEYQEIESDVKTMYRHPEDQALFTKYDVDFVVIGPNEKKVWFADDAAFLKTWKVVKANQNFLIFQR